MMISNAINKSKPSARERILIAAHELFYTEGIRATGIDRIIKQAEVTKVTFYRHFPSKNMLIIAFLEYRHQLWMDWFRDALNRYGMTIEGLLATLQEWFEKKSYRGCAFINSVAEVGTSIPEVNEIARQHKQDMTVLLDQILSPDQSRPEDANALAIAIDGAIVRAQQYNGAATSALEGLRRLAYALQKSRIS